MARWAVQVQDGMQHKEFYEYGLIPGVHYVSVDTAADVPAMVRYLQQHDSYARAVAAAGRARMSTLDGDGIASFYAELFKQYARLQRFEVQVLPSLAALQERLGALSHCPCRGASCRQDCRP